MTLAVIYNSLIDVLIGAIPFYIGDILDVFKRSYIQNLKLITGFIEDKEDIIVEVNGKALRMAIFIVVLGVVIYFVISWVVKLSSSLIDWIQSLF